MTGVLPRTIRGIRDSIPSGYFMGRVSAGNGPPELVHISTLGQRINATGVNGGNGGGQVQVAGAGISQNGRTLTVEWNGGTVDAIGPGLTIVSVGTSSTLQAVIQAIGSGLTLSSGTLEATAVSSLWNAGTVTEIGSGLTLESGTLTASGSGSGGSDGLYNINAQPTQSVTFVNIGTLNTTIQATGTPAVLGVTDAGSNATQLRGFYCPVPGSTPYRIAILVQFTGVNASYAGLQFGWTNGGTLYHNVGCYTTTSGNIESWSSATTRAATSTTGAPSPLGTAWYGLRDDGTNVYWETSADGVNFQTVNTVTKSSGYLGSTGYTNAFLGIIGQSTHPCALACRVWDTDGLSRGY